MVQSLFLIYINDIAELKNSIRKLFADEGKKYKKKINTNKKELQNDLRKMSAGDDIWELKFNTKKFTHKMFAVRKELKKKVGNCIVMLNY